MVTHIVEKKSAIPTLSEMLMRKFSSGSMDRTSTVTNFVHSSTTLGGTVAETVVECSNSSCSVANLIIPSAAGSIRSQPCLLSLNDWKENVILL